MQQFSQPLPKYRSTWVSLESQSPIILMLSILRGQAETLHTHMLWAVPLPLSLTAIPRGFSGSFYRQNQTDNHYRCGNHMNSCSPNKIIGAASK